MDNRSQQLTLSGLVLAGGRGSRLGGRDKGLVEWNGRPLVSHSLAVLESACREVLISANRNRESYLKFGHPVLADEEFADSGPLSGILAGLQHCSFEHLLLIPCDTPFLPFDLAQQLVDAHGGGERTLCVASDGKRLHPTCALIPKALHADLRDYLARGERRLRQWYDEQRMIEVPIRQGEDAFINLNAPEDFDQADALAHIT